MLNSLRSDERHSGLRFNCPPAPQSAGYAAKQEEGPSAQNFCGQGGEGRCAAKQSDGMDDFQLVPKDAEGTPKFV